MSYMSCKITLSICTDRPESHGNNLSRYRLIQRGSESHSLFMFKRKKIFPVLPLTAANQHAERLWNHTCLPTTWHRCICQAAMCSTKEHKNTGQSLKEKEHFLQNIFMNSTQKENERGKEKGKDVIFCKMALVLFNQETIVHIILH